MTLGPPLDPSGADGWRTRLAGGTATHLSSHARHPRPATSDKTNGSQALARPTASMRASSPPVATFSTASDVTDSRNPNSKPRCDSRRTRSGTRRVSVLVVPRVADRRGHVNRHGNHEDRDCGGDRPPDPRGDDRQPDQQPSTDRPSEHPAGTPFGEPIRDLHLVNIVPRQSGDCEHHSDPRRGAAVSLERRFSFRLLGAVSATRTGVSQCATSSAGTDADHRGVPQYGLAYDAALALVPSGGCLHD